MPADSTVTQALKRLIEGNQRFQEDKHNHPRRDPSTRRQLVTNQKPFAVILTCSDSRVSPSVIFDKGLGDLFVIRNAGHIADSTVIGSIEYAVEILGSRLIIVMGHENCGAVQSTIDGASGGQIENIVSHISPAVENVKEQKGDMQLNAIQCHTKMMADKIRKAAPFINKKYANGELEIIPAYYSLTTGKVEFLENI